MLFRIWYRIWLLFIFSVPNFDWGKNVISFEVDNSWSVDIDNKKIDVLVFGKGPTQWSDGTTITRKAEQDHKENFVEVFIIMDATVFYLMPHKYINLKETTLK